MKFPAAVLCRCAWRDHRRVENAASIASMLLTTECVISEEKEEKAPAHSHGGMGGGMDMM